MPYIEYRKKRFAPAILERIKRANAIITEYAKQGLTLTLRQLYYQFVSRDWLVNSQKNYKQLGETLNDARIAGLVDWNAIEDRTRNLIAPPSWDDPADIISACANQFRLDRWDDRPNYVEVWIEKDALTGVIDRVCRDTDNDDIADRMIKRIRELCPGAAVVHRAPFHGAVFFSMKLEGADPANN